MTYDDEPFSASTTFSKLIPRPPLQSEADSSQSLAERRKKTTPTPIRVGRDPRLAATAALQRPQLEPVSYVVSPLSPREMYEAGGGLESGYTSAYPSSQIPDPLRVHPQRAEIFESGERYDGEFEKSRG